jgi:predicted Zn-dependent protease
LRIVAFILFLPFLSLHLSLAKDKKNDPEEIGKRNVGRGINFYSLEKEAVLGREQAKEMELQAKILYDPPIGEYVNRIGQNLARHSDARMPFTIKVVDSEEVNACAFPGGFLFVNAGLILLANSEAELAAAMAHEIAHVAARHATRQATRGIIVDYASLILIFMGGQVGYAAREAIHVAAPIGLAKFSRMFESEADLLGLQYVDKTGYDPTSFVDFLERFESLENTKQRKITRLMSTHPSTRSRCRAIQKNIRTKLRGRPEYIVNTSEFNDMKARLVAIYARRRKLDQDWSEAMLRIRNR